MRKLTMTENMTPIDKKLIYQLLKLAKVLGCQIEDLIEPEAGDKKQEE